MIGSEIERGCGLREILEIQECSNYGLMGGITGIGYYFLCGEEAASLLRVELD